MDVLMVAKAVVVVFVRMAVPTVAPEVAPVRVKEDVWVLARVDAKALAHI